MSSSTIKVFSGRSNLPLAQSICNCLGIALGAATVNTFPDGESFVQIHENIRGEDVFIIQSACTPANHNIMELLIMIDAARRASAARITAVMPFYGYARQDRKDRPRVPITSKLVANLLVSSGASRVLTVDLHAPQITGFFDIPIDHLFAAPVFYDYCNQAFSGLEKEKSADWVVVSPDVGGMKRAAAYADMFGCSMGLVAKRRLTADQVESLNIIGDVEGKQVLLIDDMTESAGTLIAAAEALKKRGALSIKAAVTHGVLNEVGYERLKTIRVIDQLITTDTTPVDIRGLPITVLSIAPLLAEAILRIHNNKSVSSLLLLKAL